MKLVHKAKRAEKEVKKIKKVFPTVIPVPEMLYANTHISKWRNEERYGIGDVQCDARVRK